ncbi:MAG: hypothetical protein QM635_06255 [Microbacteriaceae bacterium]
MPPRDPVSGDLEGTRVRDQAPLTTSSGQVWIVVGGVFTAIVAGMLFALASLPPAGLAIAGGVAVLALFAAMVVVRVAVPRGRLRLRLLAAAMLTMALVGLVCVLVVAFVAAAALAG